MKKEFTNNEILTIYDVLNDLGSRADVVCGDTDIYWANAVNTETFEKKATQTRKIINDLVNRYFNDENTHLEKDKDGNDVKALNNDVKDEVVTKLNEEIVKLQNKKLKIDVETFSEEALKKMVKANENKLTFLEIKVLRGFIKKDDK